MPAQQQGLTLVELVITLAIASLMLGMAVPALQSVFGKAQISALVVEVSASLRFSRGEAVKQGVSVTLCPSQDASQCLEGKTPEWNQGWMVFADRSGNSDLDSADEVLRVHQFFNPQYSLRGYEGSAQRIRFLPSGFVYKSGWLEYCGADGGEAHRIMVLPTGQFKVEIEPRCITPFSPG